jgi:type III restriction enzyme
MQLKNYQRNTLNVLKAYFEQSRIIGHIEAFNKITSEPEIAARLVNLKNKYTAWDVIPNTPRVCIKVPTGGGKTIIAAHTIKIVAQTWCDTDYPFVIWFVPTDTIRRQTSDALKDSRHPYRIALNEQFEGKVRIFDLDEKFNIRPADLEENACIIVATIQSFVKEDTTKYNVYRDNENLENHFVKMPPAKYAGMEVKEEDARPKYSFSNLLYYHRPILIVDEAHKVVTDLSQETQRRLNPSAIIEFTATPQANNNTLYNVRASELKAEEMIKIPIELVEHSRWEQAVDRAISRRHVLEQDAKKEKDYIRPILLFQAQSKDKEVTVEVLKKYLLETANLPEEQIKIATGEQKELDTIDLFNPFEHTRYIITVEALKEGWDCSFAYILCSLANVHSNTAVEQLLGRVMRMPYAKSRKMSSLNKAYAHVVSAHFGAAAAALTDKLINKGFDDEEALASIQLQPPVNEELDQNWITPYNAVTLTTKLDKKSIPPSIELDSKNTLFFSGNTTQDDIKAVCEKISKDEALTLQWKYDNYIQADTKPSPADEGLSFKVPRLMVELDGQ